MQSLDLLGIDHLKASVYIARNHWLNERVIQEAWMTYGFGVLTRSGLNLDIQEPNTAWEFWMQLSWILGAKILFLSHWPWKPSLQTFLISQDLLMMGCQPGFKPWAELCPLKLSLAGPWWDVWKLKDAASNSYFLEEEGHHPEDGILNLKHFLKILPFSIMSGIMVRKSLCNMAFSYYR